MSSSASSCASSCAQPLLWVVAGVFGLLAFGATASDAVQVGGAIGNVWRNAPST
jgi:ABC-2 type transport system permease protein